MTTRSPLFNQKWACEKQPSCLYCIPCDCNNCISFEKRLQQTAYAERLKKVNQVKDCVSLQKYHENGSEKC